jgi:hypothetical protein
MTPIKPTKRIQLLGNINATRIVASSFGVLAGLTGLIAGFFEVRQGNVVPDGYWISYIGPEYSMWRDSTYDAFTIIPNLYITGILTLTTSILVLVWSVGFIHKKRGPSIMFLLSVILFLVGGAIVLYVGILASLIATRINESLTWWRSHMSVNLRRVLTRVWPWSFVIYVLISLSLLGLTILGVNDAGFPSLIRVLAGVMFIPIPLMIVCGFAYDIQRQDNLNENTK